MPRDLCLRSAQEVLDEIARLRSGGYRKTKHWSLTEICDHLAKTIEMEMNGGLARFPWIVRKAVGEPLVRGMLRHERFPRLLPFPAPRVVQPSTPTSADDPATLDACCQMIRAAEAFTGPLPPFPFADNVSIDQWRRLNWIHAAHHLGYLIPATDDAAPTAPPRAR